MEDKLQLFYNSLTANPNIKGLPGDYELFRTTLADPGKSELFYNSLKANQNIKGMPESYDEFVTGLALNSGGITPKEPEQERPGFLEGLGKKFSASVYGAGEMATETPQLGEAVKQLGVKTLADGYINRLAKRGKITPEQAEAEKKRTDTYLPKIDFLGAPHKATTEKLPGAKMADSKANKWLSETSDRLSKEGERYDKRVVDYLKAGQFGKALGAEAYSITESLAPTLLAAFGGPVGAGALGVMTGAETYDEVKDREDMQEAAKVIDGLSTGVFEALFEYLGTAEMTKMLKNAYAKGTKEQVEEALKGSLGGLLSKAYKRFGVWLAPVHEGLSEGLTTLGQNATAKFTGEDPGRKINDNFIESVLVGMGMGGLFAGTEKGMETLAKKFKGTPLDQGPAAIGELNVPYDQEQALEQINKIGRDFKFGDTLLEDDPNPVVSFAMTKLGQKVILKNEGGVNGDNFFIAFDVETSKPVLVKAGDIMERKDVPYQEWVNSELQNYNIVKAQGEKMSAQAEAPVQEGQEITIKDKNFYVSQVTPEGISLNEIDEKGNITGAALQIAPDQYNSVFGMDQGIQEEGNLPQNELPQATNEGIQTDQAAPEAQVPQGARILTVNKTNYQAVPDETGILTIDQVFTDENTAKNTLKALEKGYPKAAFSLQKTELEDFLTPDEYRITIQPKQAAVKAEQQVVEPALPQKSDVQPDVPDVKTEVTPSTLDETAPEEVKQKAGEVGLLPELLSQDQKEITPKFLSDKYSVEELDELINHLETGMKDILDEGDTQRAEKLNDLIGKVIDARNSIKKKAGEVEKPTKKEEKPKEPWQMTREEFWNQPDAQRIYGRLEDKDKDAYLSLHKVAIEEALAAGESVPPEVLADYPELLKPAADLTKANAEVDTKPTEAQKKAGNYKKGHLSVQGLNITIENPAMSVRSGTDKTGRKWSQKLNNSYGYFRRTKGKDGDQVDVFLGDNLNSESVYVIDQVDPETDLFDEHKVMLGFNSAQDAKDNYYGNYEPGWKGLGSISKMSIDQFKDWLGSGTRTKKPVDGNVPVEKKAETKPAETIPTETNQVWSGIVDLRDGSIGRTFTLQQAKDADFHHSFLVEREEEEAISNGEKAYFWIDKNGEPQNRDNTLSRSIKQNIKDELGIGSKTKPKSAEFAGNLFAKREGGKESKPKAEQEYNKLDFQKLKLSEIWATPEAHRVEDLRAEIKKAEGIVPDMPYKKTDQWAGLALRRMIRYAIDNGYDAIAWTPGEVQNERYDLSKQVDEIWIQEPPKSPGSFGITGYKGDEILFTENVPQEKLADYVGKEIADKYQKGEKNKKQNNLIVFKGNDLKVGGSGMTGFYDNILPSIANKLGKKFGAQVDKIEVGNKRFNIRLKNNGFYEINDIDGHMVMNNVDPEKIDQWKEPLYTVHSLPITEAMFDSYRQGIPLFKRPGALAGESLLLDVVSASPRETWENEVRAKVKILADSLNTKIEVINNRSQLPARIQRQALRQGITSNKHISGVYDPQTDTVYVILDDIRAAGTLRGIEEVTKTVLHEVVAHQGLPSVLGEEEYNKLLDDLFWSIPQIDRSFLMEQYNTTNPRTISEEYLGMMAEQNVNPTLFQSMLAKIRQLIRKLFKVNYTENDIHYMLRRSRENLQKPKSSDFNTAEEYLEAIDKRKNAKFRIAKAYKDNIVSKAAEVYKEKEARRTIEETKQGIREYIQDLNLPIRKFEEEVLKRGGKQDNSSKPYRDTSLSFGRQEKLYNDFFDQKMKPVLAAVANIKKSGASGEEVLPYIICKHAIERNRAFREKELNDFIESHPDAGPDKINDFQEKIKDKDYSGVMAFDKEGKYTNPDDLAKDIASEFESQVDKKLIDDLWAKLRAANSEILDAWEVGGQISPEQKQEYLAKFKYFVPLRGWREGAAKELRYTKGQGFSHSLRHAEGRKSLADNPLAYILNVEFQAIAEQVTNEVNSSMLNLIIRNLGNNEIHELATLKKLYYLKVNLPDGSYEWEPTLTRPTPEQFANDEARTRIFREHERLRAPSQAREHEVIVKKPGGDMVMIFNGKNLSVAQALNKQNYLYRSIFGNIHDARDINKAMAFLGDLNNFLKAAYTSWNVVFPFTNFMRDFQEASITQAIKQGSGLKVIRNYKHAFPAIIREIAGKQNLNNPIDRELDEFRKLGGPTGYTHLKTPEEIEKDINKEIKRMVRAGTLRGNMANATHKFVTGIEYWNRIFEDATRFAVYRASLAAGNTKEDAAYDAKEASVNFNRKGKGSKAWDAYFAFFNVALQSMQKNFGLAKNHTGNFSAVALSFVTVGFLEAMMNALFDDDDDTSYYNINPYMRQNYLIIPNIPALIKGESKGDKYLSIPLPQFWRGFKSMGAIGFDIATKRMKMKDGMMHALGNFGSSLLPVDIGGLWKSGEFSLAPIMPTVIKPIAEVIENRNYMGYAIKNEPFTKEQEKVLAHAGLGKKNVSPAAKFITDMLFRWGGGDSKYKYYYDSYEGRSKKVPGWKDINPSTLEHLFKGYTGGTGAVFSDLITTISQGLSPEQEIDYRNAPFVNRFVRKIPEAKWNVISEYYNLRDDSKIINSLSANYFKEGRYEKTMEILGDEYLMKYTEIFKHYESSLDEAKKDTDFDNVEGSYRGIELMRQCINDIKDLKEEYGR